MREKWIRRTLAPYLEKLASQFPAIAILGPRQSGKTTLAKMLFPTYRYVNLESLEEREYAEEDPRGFLSRFQKESGVILDEIQKAPKLLSALQIEIDENPKLGRFILTGSQNFVLNERIGQTLAGRIGLTTLLPLSIEELREAGLLPKTPQEAIFQGFYPRVYENQIDPVVFAESYMRTYVERDVRDLRHITSLSDFQKFLRLCAGRIGGVLNLSSLATETGISMQTAKAWLSILEASYVLFLLQPYHVNFNKRVVKSPKLYFYDTALACNLLRLTKVDDVYVHFLRGGLFESMVISNFLKRRFHRALPPNVYFWRDKSDHEVDCILDMGTHIESIEIKSSETLNAHQFDGLKKWAEITKGKVDHAKLVYGGDESLQRKGIRIDSWKNL